MLQEPMSQVEAPEAGVPQGAGRWAAVAIIFVVVLVTAFGWSMHERTVARKNALERDQVTAELRETQSQIGAVTDQLNALTEAQQAAQRAEAQRMAQEHAMASRSVAVRRRSAQENEKRWKAVQSKLDEENQAISKTQQDLEGAKTELSGSIARTHDELVLLQKKGERNYYEFDLSKSKQFQRSGPVGIALRKADTKHGFADLDLMVEDAKLQQKHVNLYQPVLFYPPDSPTPMELVINTVNKNHIHGYVSAPKYRQSELKAAADAGPTAQTASTATDANSRKRLPPPE